MTYNVDETMRRYHELLSKEPGFFLRTDCRIILMSKMMGVNRTYLSMFINREMKTTFKKLMRAASLRKMESMLRANPGRDVNDLIHEVGFNGDITFRRAYMEKYGELPSKSGYHMKI